MKKIVSRMLAACFCLFVLFLINPAERVLAAGSLQEATEIPLSGSLNGAITETNSGDYYKITVGSDSSVELDIQFISYMQWVYFKVYNSEGGEILSRNPLWNSNIKQITCDHTLYLDPGVYYIGVIQDGSRTGNYSLSLAYTKLNNIDTTYDSVIANARPISTSQSFTGVLSSTESSDVYKIDVTSPGILKSTFKAYMYRAYIKLLDADGNELFSREPYWNENIGYSVNDYEFPLEKGTYYIQVYSASYDGKYSFDNIFETVNTKETWGNGEIQTADSIQPNQWITGLMSYGESSDVYKVYVSGGIDVDLKLKAYMPYVYLKIYDANGNEIFSRSPYWNQNIGYSNNTYTVTLSSGTYYVQLKQYSGYKGKYKFMVQQKGKIADVSVSSVSNKTYTGKAIKPSVTVTHNGNRLAEDVDYTVSYKNNTKIGTAKVTIKGKGNYTGSKTVKFKIVPKKVTINTAKNTGKSAATVTWKKDSSVSGYEIFRSTKKSSGYKKVKTISKNSTVKFKDTTLKKGKTYYYKVRSYKTVNGNKVYGAYSSVKSVKVKK